MRTNKLKGTSSTQHSSPSRRSGGTKLLDIKPRKRTTSSKPRKPSPTKVGGKPAVTRKLSKEGYTKTKQWLSKSPTSKNPNHTTRFFSKTTTKMKAKGSGPLHSKSTKINYHTSLQGRKVSHADSGSTITHNVNVKKAAIGGAAAGATAYGGYKAVKAYRNHKQGTRTTSPTPTRTKGRVRRKG